jgi:hypothetical protein
MSDLTNDTQIKQVGSTCTGLQVPILASSKIYQGAMVCLTAAGYAVRAGTAATGQVVGVAQAGAAIPTSSGLVNVNLLTGVFARPLDGSNTPTIADVGGLVYAVDDFTLSSDSADGPVAGTLIGFEATTGHGLVYISPVEASSVTDLLVDARTTEAKKEIPISAAILAAGTPMAAWADNAGASAPGITLANSEAMGLRWNNFATQTAVWLRFNMPDDIDITEDATIAVYCSKVGATVGDATTFTITIFNNALGAAHDADATYGGASSAITGDAATKTVQLSTLTLLAANLGVAGEPVSMSIQPTNGLLGADDMIIHGINLVYTRKLFTA